MSFPSTYVMSDLESIGAGYVTVSYKGKNGLVFKKPAEYWLRCGEKERPLHLRTRSHERAKRISKTTLTESNPPDGVNAGQPVNLISCKTWSPKMGGSLG